MPAPGDRDTARRRAIVTVGAAMAGFIGVALAAAGGPVPLAVEGTGGWFARVPDVEVGPRPDRGGDLGEVPRGPSDSVGADVIDVLLQVIGLLVVAALIALVARSVLRAARIAWESGPVGLPPEQAPPTGVRTLTEALDVGLAALPNGPIDDVIVGCWVRLEEAAAAGGAGRRPAETSAELAVRVLASFDVPNDAVERLLELYRAARYSDHPLDEDDRAAAIAALAAIRRSIEPVPA